MAFHLCKADKTRKKMQIRGRLWDGRFIKIPADRDPAVSDQLLKNIESLNRSRRFGELPDEKLADWIEGLPEKEAARYVELGLLERRFLDKRRPIDDLLVEFLSHTKANCRDKSRTAET